MGGHLNGGTCLGKNIDDVVMAIVGSQLQRRRFPIILSFASLSLNGSAEMFAPSTSELLSFATPQFEL